MAGKKIEVRTYSGYRGEEYPRAFVLLGREIEVKEVLEAWVEEQPDRTRKRCFRVRGRDGLVHTLCRDEEAGAWSLKS